MSIVILQPKLLGANNYAGIDINDGSDWTHLCRKVQLQLAIENNQYLQLDTNTGRQRRIHPSKAGDVDRTGTMKSKSSQTAKVAEVQEIEPIAIPVESNEVMAFIHSDRLTTPGDLKITQPKWKYMVRSILRGKNILVTGEAGSGKTTAAKMAAEVLDRQCFIFNLGATQDPRGALIGNTQFSKDSGTFFAESAFVRAIQIPDSVILLDEISRAHPEAWNILMTVLDPGQRYLRLDEAIDSPTVKVADGVCFVATANIGAKYTATRVMDRALIDRFIIMEMDQLNTADESSLITSRFNINPTMAMTLAEISNLTRLESKSDSGKISSSISTRLVLEMAGLIEDGFSLAEAAEVCIYPFFDDEGGADSERTYIKQIVQKYIA